MDHFQETRTFSPFKRLANSFAGIPFGILLFFGAFPLLWWNESSSFYRLRILDQAASQVVSISPLSVNPANNGKLVYFQGKATTQQILKDALFGVALQALQLRRIVEMYQWQETVSTKTEEGSGGSSQETKTYAYAKVWSQSLIPSNQFRHPDGHENPTFMPYQSTTYGVTDTHVGAFQLDRTFVHKIDDSQPYLLTQQNYQAMDSSLRSDFTLSQGSYWSPSNNTEIGTLRVSYEVISPTQVSVIGQQNQGTIRPYAMKQGDVALLAIGNESIDALFHEAHTENQIMTWVLRGAGFFMMWFGLLLCLGPLTTLGKFIPLLGTFLQAGVSLATGLLSLILSLGTISFSWFFYRPLIGGALLGVMAILYWGGFEWIKKRAQQMKQKT